MKKLLLIFTFIFTLSFSLIASNSLAFMKPNNHRYPINPIRNMDIVSFEMEHMMSSVRAVLPFSEIPEEELSIFELDPGCVNFNVDNHLDDGGYLDFIFDTTSCGMGSHVVDFRVFLDENNVVTNVLILVDGEERDFNIESKCPQVSIERDDGYLELAFDFGGCDFCEGLNGKVYLEIYYTENNGVYTLQDVKYSYDKDFSPDLFVSCLNQQENCEKIKLSEPYDENGDSYYRNLIISFENCGDNFPVTGNIVYTFQFYKSSDRTYFNLVSEKDNLTYLDPTDYLVNFIEEHFCSKSNVSKKDIGDGKDLVTINSDINTENCDNAYYALNGHLKIEYYVSDENGEYLFDSFKDLNFTENDDKYIEINFDGNTWNINCDERIYFDGVEELTGYYELIANITIGSDNSIGYDVYIQNLDNPDITFHFSSGENGGLKFVDSNDYPYEGKGVFSLPELNVINLNNFKEYVKPIFVFDFSYGRLDEAKVDVVFHLRSVIGNYVIKNKVEKKFKVILPKNNKHLFKFFNIFDFLNYDAE